jgi:DNA-binding response OmpR family regulator
MITNKLKDLKLLYVEDEEGIRKYAMAYFNKIFSQTFEAKNAKEALKIFTDEEPHIIITDIKMGSVSGIELIKKIREKDKKCQIIILSAFLDTKYLLEAVELNLVKYLIKPISHSTLYPVLQQCIDNLTDIPSKKIFFSDTFYFDITNKKLMNDKVEIKLAKNELDLLELLSKNSSRAVSFSEIENVVWYDSVMSDNALRLLVAKLRKKLPLKTLENVPKVGYKVNAFN